MKDMNLEDLAQIFPNVIVIDNENANGNENDIDNEDQLGGLFNVKCIPDHETRFMAFVKRETEPGKFQPPSWDVVNKSTGAILGVIEYYKPWRKFIFAPEGNTVYDRTCLVDIGEFMMSKEGTRGV